MIKVKKRKILLLPGDGIGPEVIKEVKKVISWFNSNKSLDFGITCVISSSYADIFYSNCFKNGILPIILPEEKIKELSEYSKRKEEISIDLKEEKIIYGNNKIKFDIDPFKKKCLLEGLDDIALSLAKEDKINNFEKNLKNNKPWIFND